MLDLDTVASARSFEAALHAAGGAVRAVDALLSRRAPRSRSAACARPATTPSRRARWASACSTTSRSRRGMALDRLGRRARAGARLGRAPRQRHERHLLRHGRGPVRQHPPVAAVSGHGRADENGGGAGEGYTVNLPVPPGAGHDDWLSLVEHVVAPVARAYAPDLLLVSAGFDAHRDDPLANCELTEDSLRGDGRRRCARCRDELDAPLGFVLEGGYDLRRAGRVGGGDDREAPTARGRSASRAHGAQPGALVAPRARDRTTRRWWPVLALADLSRAGRPKEGRRASTAPLPPASKAPQRLALPPGSLVCNGRRKGDRRGAGSWCGAKRWLFALFGRRRWNCLRPLPAEPAVMPLVGIGH